MYAPVIVQTIAEMLKYTLVKCLSCMAGKLAAASKVPVALQLNLVLSIIPAEGCMWEGYPFPMIAGTLLPYDGNVSLARGVVEMAGKLPAEAVLYTVSGKEDGHEAKAQYTDPELAAVLVIAK